MNRDWITTSAEANLQRQMELPAAPQLCTIARESPDFFATLKDVMISVARIQGAPDNIEIHFATESQVGTGCAGFHDAPKTFDKPYIVICRQIADDAPPLMVGDIYSGLVVHETGHIKYTRDFYRPAKPPSKALKDLQNTLEDERIESQTRLDTPGFRHALQRTKEVLLKKCVSHLKNFKRLPDLDVLDLLIFAFVRMPHHLPHALEVWRTVEGDVAFDEVRKILPQEPQTEADVLRLAEELLQLRKRLERQYAGTAQQLAARKNNADEETFARQLKQVENAAVDRARRRSSSADALADNLRTESERLRAVADRCRNPQAVRQAARRLDVLAANTDHGKDVMRELLRRRFVLHEYLNELDHVQKAFTPEELETIEKSRQTKGTATDGVTRVDEKSWSWNGARRTEICTVDADAVAQRRYQEALSAVSHHVRGLQRVLQLQLDERTVIDHEQTQGRLDRRRLVQGLFDDRIFQTKRLVTSPAFALCLLLDESASMTEHKRSLHALRVAVMIAEAARDIPLMQLEIYSHTTGGNDHHDCIIRHFFGAEQPDRQAIGDYGIVRNGANYDHQAIEVVADRFRKQAPQATRLLLVVSDGRPNGRKFGGPSAIKATRAAVDTARRQGTRVLGIALGQFNAHNIYGEQNLLQFTDMPEFAANVRRLLTRVIRA